MQGLLRSRLLPPQLPPACLRRPALVARIVERVSGRLVVVVAGAGYGKTTLLTLTLAELPRPWVWCSCDPRLSEPGPLLAHIAAGLTERFPGFGARLVLEGSAEEQVAELGNEILETIADDFVLVLDDVHTLAEPAAEALRLLVEDLPPTAHLALAGRMPLPFPLGRLRAAQVLELSERELALSEEESGRLLGAVGMELDPEALSRLHRETEGWIAGLIIAARSGAPAPGPDDAAAYFEYLADEVLGRQPPEIRRFLLDTAVLDSFTPEVARAVTGRADAGDLARRLVADHLFTVRASLLLTRGEHEASFDAFERAIDQLLAAGESERAAAAFLRLLQSMITAGTRPTRRIEAGLRYAGRLDPGARMLPAARILLASSYAYACRFGEAEAELAAALDLPSAAGSGVLPIYADIVRAYYIRYQVGRPEEALLALDEAIAALEVHEAEDELAFMPYARMFRTYLLNDTARHAEALEETVRTQEAAARRGMRRTHQRVVAWIRAVALAGLGLWDELDAELAPPARAGPHVEATSYSYRYRALAARLAAERGAGGEVQAHIAAARADMRAFGVGFDNPMVLCDLARAAFVAGLVELARDQAAEARAIGRAIAGPLGQARGALLEARARGSGEAGDAALAEALELTERWSLTMLWTRRERWAAAPLLARGLRGRLGPEGSAARLAAACGGEVLRECVERLRDAPAQVRTELAEITGDAVNVEAGVLEGLLRDRDPGVRAAARLARGRLDTRPRPALGLVTLGHFAVERDGVPVPDGALGRQKARALLGALLAARGAVHREALMEWLWADLPPERAAAALRVTLHELRRALAPELEANAPGSPLVSGGETIRLVLDDRDHWDAAAMLRLARPAGDDEPAEAAIARLRRAEALYGGPFLPEWPYDEWARGFRAELEETHREILEQLADALARAGRVAEAIRRYRRLVGLEPEREGWHRALMRCYASAGERAQALRQYHACRTVLLREQGVPPGPETRALYAELLAVGAPLEEAGGADG